MLQTERLSLLPWDESDLAAFRPIATDPDVMRFINGGIPWSDTQIMEFVQRQIRQYRDLGYCLWRLHLREENALIGFCGIQPIIVEDTHDIEIGWWLAKARWGNGYVTEAARVVLNDSFERVGLKRLIAIIRPANDRSIAVASRLGMQYERAAVYKGVNVSLYAISG